MYFTGRTWRPPYEAHSVIIQATSGCTYNKCRFCSLYKGECFRMSPIEEFEEDLAEIKNYQPNARRIFWTGANPFVMSYENLKLRALTVRDYLIKCQTMAMFASIHIDTHFVTHISAQTIYLQLNVADQSPTFSSFTTESGAKSMLFR